VVGVDGRLERLDRLMDVALLDVDLRAAAPHHHQALAPVLRLEVADVLAQRLRPRTLAGAGLDVDPLQPLDVALVEDRRHGLDAHEEVRDGLDVGVPVQHARVDGALVRVGRERVPRAEHHVAQLRQGHEVLDGRHPVLGALAQADGAHLRDAADGAAHASAHQLHARDERGGDGSQAGKENAQAPLGGARHVTVAAHGVSYLLAGVRAARRAAAGCTGAAGVRVCW